VEASQQRGVHDENTGEVLPTYITTGRSLSPPRLPAFDPRLGELYARGYQLLSPGERSVGASYSPKNITRSAQWPLLSTLHQPGETRDMQEEQAPPMGYTRPPRSGVRRKRRGTWSIAMSCSDWKPRGHKSSKSKQ
jgi:hypothetical protein